jgi:hypothetical protein
MYLYTYMLHVLILICCSASTWTTLPGTLRGCSCAPATWFTGEAVTLAFKLVTTWYGKLLIAVISNRSGSNVWHRMERCVAVRAHLQRGLQVRHSL